MTQERTMRAMKVIGHLRFSNGVSLGTLAGIHGLVDAVCAAIVFSLVHIYPLSGREYLKLIIIYNVLAFALQPLCGVLTDHFQSARLSALAGIVFSLAAIMSVMHHPYLTVILAGVGNASFHIGGGVASMAMKHDRAGPPGIFVAPGAIGLAIGAAIGGRGIPPMQPLMGLLTAAMIAVALCTFPGREIVVDKKRQHLSNREVIIMLLLLSVALRSLLGFSIGSFWQGNRPVLLSFAIAAMCGKAAGGLISDRFGWTRTGTAALMLAAVLFGWGATYAWCAVGGMLLLQMTMPVTLTALYRVFPGKPGLVFGLCCLALVIGAAPAFSPWAASLRNVFFVIVPCAFLSVATFFKGLKMVQRERAAAMVSDSMLKRMEMVV
ncbi:MAG: hypothetical protein JW913_20200 [Chitinispirillaceae bacterium]|nr:hypothetical protein [Chitinispirillaceae bacterium]